METKVKSILSRAAASINSHEKLDLSLLSLSEVVSGDCDFCFWWLSLAALMIGLLQVSVKILGGLMALGYEIGSILKRNSISYSDDKLTIKIDDIEGMDQKFVQASAAYHATFPPF